MVRLFLTEEDGSVDAEAEPAKGEHRRETVHGGSRPGPSGGVATPAAGIAASPSTSAAGITASAASVASRGETATQTITAADVLDEIEETEFSLPPDKPLTLASYMAGSASAGIVTTAFVEPISVGDRLPDMPAYIVHFGYVLVPLEATYQATFADCPPDMRFLVETGRVPGEDE